MPLELCFDRMALWASALDRVYAPHKGKTPFCFGTCHTNEKPLRGGEEIELQGLDLALLLIAERLERTAKGLLADPLQLGTEVLAPSAD